MRGSLLTSKNGKEVSVDGIQSDRGVPEGVAQNLKGLPGRP